MRTYAIDISSLNKPALIILFSGMICSAIVITLFDYLVGLLTIGFFIGGGVFGRLVERQYQLGTGKRPSKRLGRLSCIWYLIVWYCGTFVFRRKHLFAMDARNHSEYVSVMFFSGIHLTGGMS